MDYSNILNALGSPKELAEKLSTERNQTVDTQRVIKWRQRNSIPSEFWIDIVGVAPDHMKLTLEHLASVSRSQSLAA